MSLTVVILGMHRSGTSLVANALSRFDMYLGNNLMNGPSIDNLEGHGETWEAVEINDEILRRSGGDWQSPPDRLADIDQPLAEQMGRFIAELQTRAVAGWKDPRTTLTFPRWKPFLGRYRIVACLRHPMNVARSLQVRNNLPIDKGLALWAAYNRQLLDHVSRETECFWVNFDAPEAELVGRIQTICSRLGLRGNAGNLTNFNPFLRHHQELPPIPDRAIQELYDRLAEKAAPGAPSSGLPTARTSEELPLHLAQLKHVVGLQNQALQRAVHDARQNYLDLFQSHQNLCQDHQVLSRHQQSIFQAHENLSQAHENLRRELASLQHDLRHLRSLKQWLASSFVYRCYRYLRSLSGQGALRSAGRLPVSLPGLPVSPWSRKRSLP